MMDKEKFSVKGEIFGIRKFNIEVKARSEGHAKSVAISMLGGRHRLKKNGIKINEIRKV